MPSSKYKRLFRTRLNSKLCTVLTSLRKENVFLKKTLADLFHYHSEHNRLVERFLSHETVRLEFCHRLAIKDKNPALLSEQPSMKEENHKDTHVSVDEQDSTSDECTLRKLTELQNQLNDALEKNKQWLEYDQQREAYVRAVLDRMLWPEKQQYNANQALSQQHNKDHSDEKEQLRQMLEDVKFFFKKASDGLEMLAAKVDMIHQNVTTFNLDKEKENEELKQQLQSETASGKDAAEGDHDSEEQQLREEKKDLQRRYDEEKCRSASYELQMNLCQKFMSDRLQEDLEKIEDLERQIKISSQDLEDERQDCAYLMTQMDRVLKMLQNTKDCVTNPSKRHQQGHSSSEAEHPPCLTTRETSPPAFPHSSLLDVSFLLCPSCQAKYFASQYRELMTHLEDCLERTTE